MCEWIFAGVFSTGRTQAPKRDWCFPAGRYVRRRGSGGSPPGALSAPKGEWPYTEATPSGAAPTSPPEGVFRHKRRMELDELSGRTTGRLGYIGPTMLREYVGRTTSRTTGRATGCTMDHATDRATQRCTPDQQPLLRHRAVGPAPVQRWILTYGDQGPAPLVRRK